MSKNITLNGQTYSGVSEVELPVSGGTAKFKDEDEIVAPTGKKNITDTAETDVTNYASAQVVDANLVPENIAAGAVVLGVVGTHQGGGDITIEPLTVNENGTTVAPSGKAYSPVTVNVAGRTNYYELTGGGSSSSTKQDVELTYHGTVVNGLGGYIGYWWNWVLYFADPITEIKDNAFYNKASASSGYKMSLTSVDNFAALTTLGSACFRGTGIENVEFPSVESLMADGTNGQFAQCKFLKSLHLPKLTSWNKTIAYSLNNTVLTDVQIGSVGYGITTYPSAGDFSGATNASLVITLHTTGENVDGIISAMRSANTTATITVKASESTTYGGQSFAAGDTIKTDTPAA